MPGPTLDFRRIADAALASLETLLHEWLPSGHREGHEYKALNPTRSDTRAGSFSVNINSGAWADFATDDKGGDAISLYAYLNAVSQPEAARAIAARLGIVERAAEAAPPERRARTEWIPIVPAPADAPEPPKAHIKRRFPEATWRYLSGTGELIGLVYRFRTSDGGKEILPCCYARHAQTGAMEWRWLAFPEPRPMYGLPRLDARPVLIVEGEKCADAAHDALGGAEASLSVLSWPGGAKAVDKVDWSPLAGRQVLIWPDCDAQLDKATRELLSEPLQPGVKAAERIAAKLLALDPPAKVKVVRIPPPGEKPGGWDVADAIADGMTRDELLTFMRTRQRDPACIAESISTQKGAHAEVLDDDQWQRALIWSGKGLKDCRENVIYILRDHPAWNGVLGADVFSKRIMTRKPSPLGHQAGVEWSADDDVQFGLWAAAQRDQLLVRNLDTIRQGVQHVAKLARFHPVREYLEALEFRGDSLIDTWATRFLGSPDTPYTRKVARLFLLNMVRRVYMPGCIMRSVPVLEGPQDKGKSTALRILAAPWSADTPFRVGDKDSYQLIQGVLLYEISELESFTRAEATAVKAFVSSVEDYFRAPYERQPEKHPRSTVFAASTNAVEYLKDWTGNTRFWPLPTGSRIDLDGLAAARDQLLAEALYLWRQGAPTYPTPEELVELFKPEQDRRMMVHPWHDMISDVLLHDVDWKFRETLTVRDVLAGVIKVDLSRLNPQGSEAQRVGQILHSLGWYKRRASDASRAWIWARPIVEAAPPAPQPHDDEPIPF